MLYTHKPDLTAMGKSLIHNERVGGNGWKNPAVMASWRHIQHRTRGVVDSCNNDSSWIAPTLLADVCCHNFLCRWGVQQTGSLRPPPLWKDTFLCAPVRGSQKRSSWGWYFLFITRAIVQSDLVENTLIKYPKIFKPIFFLFFFFIFHQNVLHGVSWSGSACERCNSSVVRYSGKLVLK